MEDEQTQKIPLPRTYRGRVSAAFEERTMAMLSPITRPENLSDSSFTGLDKSIKLLDNELRRTPKLALSREAQLNRRSFRRQSILEDATMFVPIPQQQTSRLSEYPFASDNTAAFLRPLPGARIPEEEMALGEENPTLRATDYLFREFLTASQERPAEHQTFHLLSVYEGMLTGHVDSLRNVLKNAPQGHPKLESTSKLESFLRLERDTWRLIGSLYQDRMNAQDVDMEEDEEYLLADLEGSETSDKVVIQKLYERDSSLRQMQVIVDWLERNAGDLYGDTFYDKVEYFNEPSAGWENTLRNLKNKSQGLGSATDRNLVTELDPDAPFRQKKPLHDLDQEDEHRLLRCVFALLRCGQLEEAQLLCHRSGQSWRAAMFEGWRPYHDPNRETAALPLGEKLPVEGNLYRDVWKAVAYAACSSTSPSLPLYEKAALGSFCGHLDAILPACESWEDALWAHVKVAIDTRVEKKLRNHHRHSKGHTWEDRPLEELPADYWQHDCSLEQIVSGLAASSQSTVRIASAHPFRVIQRHVILDDVDGMLETMASWTANGLRDLPDVDDVTYPHLLRAMAHIVLCFKQMGKLTKDEAAEAIMESYVKYVAEVPYLELVASYVAHLPADMQVSIYAQFLGSLGPESETETDKKYCLTLADESGLDVAAIAKSLVEFIRGLSDPEDTSQNAPRKSTSLDDKKIASLDWLLIYPEHREEALAQAHAYVRYCIGVGKQEAAQTAFKKIPADSVGLIMTQWKAQTDSADLPASVQNTIKEHLCLKSYLEAQAFFNDWFTHFHHNKPAMPSTVADSKSEKGLGRAGAQVSFTEKLAREHREKQYQADLNRWKAALSIITEKTVEKLYNVLLFPDGGWLVDPENTQDEERARQLVLLRERCIPQVTNLLCTVLLSTEQWKECLRLADLVAAELPGLYKVFGPEELAHLLSNLGQAYVAVLDQGQEW